MLQQHYRDAGQLHRYMRRCIDRPEQGAGWRRAADGSKRDNMRRAASYRRPRASPPLPQRYHFGRDHREIAAFTCHVLVKVSKKVFTFVLSSPFLCPTSKRIGLVYLLEYCQLKMGLEQSRSKHDKISLVSRGKHDKISVVSKANT